MKRSALMLTLAAVACALSCAGAARATTYSVSPDGFGDYATIQAAIDAAVDTDIIELTDGTFTGDGNRDIDFGGKAITVRSQSDEPTACILDCDGSTSEPHRGFYFHSGETGTSVLQGITITDGCAYDAVDDHRGGGGILCDGASPSIVNCVVSNCRAGGLAALGAGVLARGSAHPSLSFCVITENTSALPDAVYGAGISVWEPARLDATSCVISFNSTNGPGGGVYDQSGLGCWFWDCVIRANQGGSGGGGMRIGSSGTVVQYCAIVENTSETEGGGLLLMGGTASHCTVAGNSALLGGNIAVKYGTATIEDSIIAFGTGGGGISGYVPGDAATITCCDVYGNAGGDYDGVIIPDQTGSNGNISEDPLFCSAPNLDYSIDAQSPCAAANNSCGILLGMYGVGCDSPVEQASWGSIKALFRAEGPRP